MDVRANPFKEPAMAIVIQAHHPVTAQEAQWCVDVAEHYLRQSDLAAFLWDELKRVPEVLTINVHHAAPGVIGNTWTPPALGVVGSAGSVTWNVNRTLTATEVVSDKPGLTTFQKVLAAFTPDKQQVMSPALLLMHEMGHAFQFLSDQVVQEQGNSFRQRLTAVINGDKALRTEIENINVNAIENTVANELTAKGSPEGIRWTYAKAQVNN
jgi:hypothetical protein